MTENKNTKKNYEYEYEHFTVTKEFKKEIEEYTKKSGFTTKSDFIRDAIKEKIERIKNPTKVNTSGPQINSAFFNEITKNSRKMIELQEITVDKLKNFNEIQEILQLIQKYSIRTDLQKETNKIENLLKARANLSIEQIADKLDLDINLVKDIMAANNNKQFKLNIKTGRWILNE